ncbi:hypothetical protein DAPPUDRAFT_259072 [Daphnia pulex]|uniref:Uncharacterized protein n=1 Tax=Daphnia pulex TaxID=6669 RepID=E9HGI4_DAPPU|nr:hypothetical protein DAPPUDRAFT_259072 [Daphnia pulex]|eukprot:EFX69162.1 hypothetical protein DAPPUDRAFT_259072 [Daphnia pulex]
MGAEELRGAKISTAGGSSDFITMSDDLSKVNKQNLKIFGVVSTDFQLRYSSASGGRKRNENSARGRYHQRLKNFCRALWEQRLLLSSFMSNREYGGATL